MPRGNRIGSDGGVFHLTQRCHNRQFLLKFTRDRVQRESCWTESLATGSRGFVERMAPQIKWRRETETWKSSDDLWVLRESEVPYSPERGRESGAKDTEQAPMLHILLETTHMPRRQSESQSESRGRGRAN
jgi:hypothetical protein